MSIDKLISVIVPAHNHEKYVQEAIQSVLRQDYPNIELLVIDDGSIDYTWRKIVKMREECIRHLARVSLVRQKNMGRSKTLNRLIAEARGEYIFLLASDDRIAPGALSILKTCLDQNKGCVLAVGDNEIIDENSMRTFWDSRWQATNASSAVYKTFGQALKLDKIGNSFGLYKSLLLGNHIPNGYMIRASALDDIGGYSQKTAIEDYVMNLQLSKMGRMFFVPQILYSYRWHTANTVKARSFKRELWAEYCLIFAGEFHYAIRHGALSYLLWGWMRIILRLSRDILIA